ncbi:hypothetical protein HK405_015782, partial [Cladochytrium tenue]
PYVRSLSAVADTAKPPVASASPPLPPPPLPRDAKQQPLPPPSASTAATPHDPQTPPPPPSAANVAPARENIYTLANMLTVSRILLTPAIGAAIVAGDAGTALALLTAAAATDALDGAVARWYNQKTFFGSILDPAADKILMTTLTATLAYGGLLP